MIVDILLLVITSISALYFGFAVLKKNAKSHSNRLFFIFSISLVCWSLVNFLSLYTQNESLILFWMRVVMALAVVQSISFLFFISTFPKNRITIRKKYYIPILIFGIFTIIICFTPFLFKSILIYGDNIVPEVSFGIIFFLLATIGSLLSGFIILIKKYFTETGLVKIQFKYIFLGSFLMFSLIILFNLFFVIIFEKSEFVRWGPLFVLPFIISTAYVMVKYRFLDIHLVVKKATAYLITTIIILVIYTGLIIYAQQNLVDYYNWDNTWTMVGAVLIIALSFEPLRKIVISLVNKAIYTKKEKKYFLNKKKAKKYAQKLQIEQKAATQVEDVVNKIIANYLFFLNAEMVRLLLYKQKTGRLACAYPKHNEISLKIDSALYNYVNANPEILMTQEIPFLLEDENTANNDLLKKAEKYLKRNNILAVVPIGEKDSVIGLFLLGNKLDNEVYTKEDIDTLYDFRKDYTPILANVIMYKEAVERIEV